MLRKLQAHSQSVAVVAAVLALLFGVPANGVAQGPQGQIVVFGDSLSDPGNAFVFVHTSSTPPDYGLGPLLLPAAPYARGGHHMSNGATWIEQLATPLGLAASVQPAFQSSSPYAMNFAVATARARDDGTNPSLALLVGTFLQRTGGVAPSDAMYVIQIGGNDIRDALASGNALEALAILQAAATAVAEAVSTLYAVGARNFLIWNAPDVSLTPTVQFLDAQMPGTALAANLATTTFNALLVAALAPLSGLPGINIVPFDAFALITAIVNNPAQFGLSNVTDACVTPNVPPFACQRPDEYLFWDGIHPTTAAHGIIAQAVAMVLGL